MLDVVLEVNQDKEFASSMEEIKMANIEGSEIQRTTNGKQVPKKKLPQYYDKQQQLGLVLATQELLKFDDHDLAHINSNEEGKCWTNIKDIDFWKYIICMKLLNEGILPDIIDLEENKRVKKKIINYHW
jgi:hypothetical protein